MPQVKGRPLNPKLKYRRRAFLEFLATTRFESTEELTSQWWEANATSMHCRIPLKCSICNHSSQPKFHDFFGMGRQRGKAACGCNHAQWFRESGRVILLSKMEDAGFEPLGFMLCPQKYEAAKINAYTVLPMRCKKCGIEPTSCNLGNFLQFKSARCGCLFKTQCMVLGVAKEMMEKAAPQSMTIRSEVCFKHKKSEAGGKMTYDIVIFRNSDRRVLLIIEIDGMQHFWDCFSHLQSVNGQSSLENHLKTQRNDLQKEIDALNGCIPIVRIDQESIYFKEVKRGGCEWRPYLKDCITKAWKGTLELKVHRLSAKLRYHSGPYMEMRVGTRVEVD